MMPTRIIFLGTPDFAVASLQALHRAGFNIVGVVTAPDKPAGRGLQLTQSAVKKYAVENGLHVLQPPKLKDPEFVQSLKDLHPDLQVVVAFRMLPEIVWNMPKLGTINVHGSLLPQYRGAAPINWAIINGERQTGVTTFKLKHEIDTGNILQQEIIKIGDDETAGELHDRMKIIGAELLVRTVNDVLSSKFSEVSQTDTGIVNEELKHAPKIFTETTRVDWNRSIRDIYNLIRGLSPVPAAFTILNDKKLKIFKAIKEPIPNTTPGEILTDNKSYLKIAGSDGYIDLKEIQLEGKKRMSVVEFLRGNKVNTK